MERCSWLWGYNNGQEIEITQTGYLYVYVSNESRGSVYFDDLMIEHIHGPLLEETHYYPFGLTMAGISSKTAQFGTPSNKLKYNGKEEQRQEFSDGSGFEWSDYGARMYDNQIGRWCVIDLMFEKHTEYSPYAYVYNNPVLYFDQFGLDTFLVDNRGKFAEKSLPSDENDVIIKVSNKERKKNLIKYNKDGSLKKRHKTSQSFEKGSISVRKKNRN